MRLPLRAALVAVLVTPTVALTTSAAQAQPSDWPGAAPVADAVGITNATGQVRFDASLSYDPENTALTYTWDFGDGVTGTGVAPSHTYGSGTGPITAVVTATDRAGMSSTDRITVAPYESSPTITLAGPGPDARFAVGDEIKLTGAATDAEDGGLSITWDVTHVQCSTGSCTRVAQQPVDGPSIDGRFPRRDRTMVEYTARVVDSRGTEAAARYTARPRTSTVTVQSSTPSSVWAGAPNQTTQTATVGTRVQVVAPQNATDAVLTFDEWSHNSSQDLRIGVTVIDGGLTVTAKYLSPIQRRYRDDTNIATLLGAAQGTETLDGATRYQVYAGGRLYWTEAEGVHQVSGAILDAYLRAGGHQVLGAPSTDETGTLDNNGRFNHFAGVGALPASVFFSPDTGAHALQGAIRARYAALGFERVLGYPTTGELGTPDGVGRYNHFRTPGGIVGSIYWTPGTGAHDITGAVRETWARLGYETGPLGYPKTGELSTPGGVGRYNHFVGTGGNDASIYWTPATGAHEVLGLIRARWAELGFERSYLGFPRSGEYSAGSDRRSDFQNGYIVFNRTTGVRDSRY